MLFEEEKEESVFETVEEPAEEEKKSENDEKEESKTTEEYVDSDPSKSAQWYVANTMSGREKIVKDYLEKRRESLGLENEIFRVVVPEREEQVIDKKTGQPAFKKNGEKKIKIVNLYPGYVFVEAIMSDDAWYVIRNTPGITGIVGSSGSGAKPFPVPKEEILPILKEMKLVVPAARSDYKVGEIVKILKGPFEGSIGKISEINAELKQAKVNITFFGRQNTVDIDFDDLEKETY